MAEHYSSDARRRFLKLVAAGAAAVPAAALLSRRGVAQEQVDPEGALAQQFGYVHDVADVDTESFPTYEEGQHCANCQLFQGAEGDEWGPCPIFQNNLVAANGWCQSWVAKPS
ncbi:MAG: high-potential iron-sulfur protein [Azospirillaceae bacterium]